MNQLLFLLFILLSNCVLAQRDGSMQRLELLKKKIRNSTYFDSSVVFSSGSQAIAISRELHAPVEEGIIYLLYGNFYYNSRNLPKARYYYNKALQIANAEENQQLRNSVDIRFAFILSEKDIEQAEQRLLKLYEEAVAGKFTDNQIEACNGLGVLAQRRTLNERALSWYYRGLRVAEKTKSRRFIALLLNNIGLLKMQTKQLSSAREDLERSLGIAEAENDKRMIAVLVNNLGQTSFELKDYPSAVRHYRKSLELNRKQGFPAQLAASYLNLAQSYTLNKQYDLAKPMVDSGLALSNTIQQFDFIGQGYYVAGMIAASTNNIALAHKYIDSMVALEKKVPIAQNYLSIFDLKAYVAEKEHRFAEALKWKTQYFEKTDSLNNKMNLKTLAEMQLLYGREQAENQLAKEKVSNKLLRKDKQLQAARLRSVLFISVALVLVTIAFVLLRTVLLKQRRERKFTSQLMEEIDRERIRISKDLHDDIGQLLSVAKSRVNLFNSGKIKSLDGLERDLGEVIEHTREISHSLHPATLEKFGLASSLQALADKVMEHSGKVFTLKVEDTAELPLETTSQIYRIVQECVNNTLKHAGATAISFELQRREGQWHFDYRDNGSGADDEMIRSGFGFMTMRERARTFNGRLLVESGKNEGIHITIRFE